jgi:AcrR family transcriptional regulator
MDDTPARFDDVGEVRRGRPRSQEARRAVLDAARSLLVDVGYKQLTIQGVARAAGVGKQTIYRWWPSKAAIIAEATLHDIVPGSQLALPDTGSIRSDLQTWVAALVERVGGTEGAAQIRALSAAVATDIDAGRTLYEHLTGPELNAIVARLEAAQREGQVRADADLRGAADALLGFVAFIVLTGEPITVDRGLGLLDVVLTGIEAGPR